jgi:hypothetical protein
MKKQDNPRPDHIDAANSWLLLATLYNMPDYLRFQYLRLYDAALVRAFAEVA